MGNVQTTSKAAFAALAHTDSQCARIARMLLYHSNQGRGLTIGELKHACRFQEKGTVSARLMDLRYKVTRFGKQPRVLLIDGAEYEVYSSGKRRCSISGKTCIEWMMLPAVQSPQIEINFN